MGNTTSTADLSKTAIENRYELFYESKEAADCEISVKDGQIYKTIKAHKYILAFASSVLYAMLFNENLKDSKTPIVLVDDIDFETMNIFLRFLYLRKAEVVSTESALKVLYAAHKYKVEGLIIISGEYLIESVSPENVVQILEFESKIENPELREAILENVSTKLEAIVKSDGFFTASLNVFYVILENSQLNMIRQDVLYKAIDQYASHNGYLRTEMDKAIRKIRFLSMNTKEFIHACMQSKLLTLEEKQAIMCYIVEPSDPNCAYPEGFSYVKDYYTSWESAKCENIKLEDGKKRDDSTLAYFLFVNPVYQKGRDHLLNQLKANGLNYSSGESCVSYLEKIHMSENANTLMAIHEFFELHKIKSFSELKECTDAGCLK